MLPENRLKTWIFGRIAFFAKWVYLGYFKTIKIQVCNPELAPQNLSAPNAIYGSWHSKTFLLLPYCRNSKTVLLTLLDWKNYFYDKLSLSFGYKTIPVTSNSRATIRLLQHLRQNFHVGLAVDGPKGPRGIIKPGVLYLSSKSKKPLVIISVKCFNSIRLTWRWDRYEIPLPFSKAEIVFNPPIVLADNGFVSQPRISTLLGAP